jgi:hypothetical protein
MKRALLVFISVSAILLLKNVSISGASPSAPAIKVFSATPSLLPLKGGTAVFRQTVVGAKSCTLTTVADADGTEGSNVRTIPCSILGSESVPFPSNTSGGGVTYFFTLTAVSATGKRTSKTVSVSIGHPARGGGPSVTTTTTPTTTMPRLVAPVQSVIEGEVNRGYNSAVGAQFYPGDTIVQFFCPDYDPSLYATGYQVRCEGTGLNSVGEVTVYMTYTVTNAASGAYSLSW